MSKLSVFVAALALVLGGCAGEVEGPEEFAFTTEWSGLYQRASLAAEQVNAEDPTVLVTVELLPGDATQEERNLANLIQDEHSGPSTTEDKTRVVIGGNAWTLALYVGEEATEEAIADGMREWIDRLSTREPAE